MRNTELAALIDPDPIKRPTDYAIDLFLEHADYIFVGGTPSETMRDISGLTFECIARIKSRREKKTKYTPIWIFPGAPAQNVPGADAFLYLYVPNAKNSYFGWFVQVHSIYDVLKNYSKGKILHTAYPVLGGETARFVDAEEWDEEELVKLAELSNQLNFSCYYLEGGSGAEMLDSHTIKSVSDTLVRPKFIYGGGVNEEERVRNLFGVADIINIGTELERDPDFVVKARDVIENMKAP